MNRSSRRTASSSVGDSAALNMAGKNGRSRSTRDLNKPNNTKNGQYQPSNIELALDPLFPMELRQKPLLGRWIPVHLLLLGLYGSAFALAGVSVHVPSWSTSRAQQLTIVGWLAHLAGALLLLAAGVALLIKRQPFFPKMLVSYLFSLIFFVVGSILHTGYLGIDEDDDSNATATDGTNPTNGNSVFSLDYDLTSLSIKLQWLAALVYYIFVAYLVWKAPNSLTTNADAEDHGKHRQLLELRELALFNKELNAQMEAEAAADEADMAQLAADMHAEMQMQQQQCMDGDDGDGGDTQGGQTVRFQTTGSISGTGGDRLTAADILTLDRGEGAAAGAGGGGGAYSRPQTTTTTAATTNNYPATSQTEEDDDDGGDEAEGTTNDQDQEQDQEQRMRQALLLQQSLTEEATRLLRAR